MSYVILACQRGNETNDAIYGSLKSRVSSVCDEVCKFDVPESLKFGSFDGLIKLMDDLQKYDSQVEQVLRRIERQVLELDPSADFKVVFRNKSSSIETYIRSFTWDEAKFPSNRSVADNLTQLWTLVSRIDEDVKSKAYSFGDLKSNLTASTKNKSAGLTLATADLGDVLTPDVVNPDDFISKEHLETIVVVVPRDQEEMWKSSYEKMNRFVVPRSTKQFMKKVGSKTVPLEDKDGNTLWRVVLFKSVIESFRTDAKAQKFTAREFAYSEAAYKEQLKKQDSLKAEFEKQEIALKRACGWAFSDTLVAWMHLKAMRVFVESVLRYGVPANFASFVVKPSQKNITRLRGLLNEVFSTRSVFGQSYNQQAKEDEGEEYFPYVSLSFSPQADKASS